MNWGVRLADRRQAGHLIEVVCKQLLKKFFFASWWLEGAPLLILRIVCLRDPRPWLEVVSAV